jgi:catechol 2,3-dioxygenase-like lactoylglutathione lyase family enzyme
MIGIDKVSLNVRDQDAAKRFWVETVGAEVVRDEPMGEQGGARWIEVRPPLGQVTLVLFAPHFDDKQVGQLGPVLFTCEDITKTYEELRARGVEFADAPSRQYWGWWATFKDNDGNVYGLGQRER